MEMKDLIHKYRTEAGLTQQEVATRLGTTKQAIQKYEKGTVKNIPYDKVVALANVFGVLPSTMLGFETNVDDNDVLIGIYQSLDEQRRDMLIEYAKYLQSRV